MATDVSLRSSLLRTYTPGAVLGAGHCSGGKQRAHPCPPELVKWCRQTPVWQSVDKHAVRVLGQRCGVEACSTERFHRGRTRPLPKPPPQTAAPYLPCCSAENPRHALPPTACSPGRWALLLWLRQLESDPLPRHVPPSSHGSAARWAVTWDFCPVGVPSPQLQRDPQAIRPGHSLASALQHQLSTQTNLKPFHGSAAHLPPAVPAPSPDALLPPSAQACDLTVPCTSEHEPLQDASHRLQGSSPDILTATPYCLRVYS